MSDRVENIERKSRSYLLQAISPLLTMFSTTMYLKCDKMRYCVVMGERKSTDGRMHDGQRVMPTASGAKNSKAKYAENSIFSFYTIIAFELFFQNC